MKRLLSLLLAPVIFFAGLLGGWKALSLPQGSDRTYVRNDATVFLQHWHRMLRPAMLGGAVLVLLGCGLAYVGQHAGTLAACLLFLALLVPSRISHALGVALTTARDTHERAGDVIQLDVAASTKIYLGSLVAVDSSGNAKPGADTAGLTGIGRAEQTVDNSSGSAGALKINVKRGVFRFGNSGTNALTKAHIGTIAYLEDDQTVASSTNQSIKAGLVVGVETGGVWIDTRFHLPVAGSVADAAVTAAKLANAVADAIYSTTVAVANTGTPDGVAHITGQVKDVQGNALSGRFLVRVFLDDAAYTAVEDLGTATAAANSLILKELTDDAYIDVLTHSDGSWGIDLDTASNGTVHAHAAVVGQFATANAAITGNP